MISDIIVKYGSKLSVTKAWLMNLNIQDYLGMSDKFTSMLYSKASGIITPEVEKTMTWLEEHKTKDLDRVQVTENFDTKDFAFSVKDDDVETINKQSMHIFLELTDVIEGDPRLSYIMVFIPKYGFVSQKQWTTVVETAPMKHISLPM